MARSFTKACSWGNTSCASRVKVLNLRPPKPRSAGKPLQTVFRLPDSWRLRWLCHQQRRAKVQPPQLSIAQEDADPAQENLQQLMLTLFAVWSAQHVPYGLPHFGEALDLLQPLALICRLLSSLLAQLVQAAVILVQQHLPSTGNQATDLRPRPWPYVNMSAMRPVQGFVHLQAFLQPDCAACTGCPHTCPAIPALCRALAGAIHQASGASLHSAFCGLGITLPC